MKTSFLRPAEGRLRAEGTLLDKTTTMAFTEGRVFDEAGRLCAHATGTFKYLRGLPTGGRRSKTLQRASEPDQQEPE
jgi:acyl-coenzyme A thioesterase PaaI-like protein